jgi:hypothetical protein
LGVGALKRMLLQQRGWTVSENGIKKVRWCCERWCCDVLHLPLLHVAPAFVAYVCSSSMIQALKVLRPVAAGSATANGSGRA